MATRKRTLARRYRLFEEIGSGGMGTVYRARDTRTGHTVAVKILHPHLTRDPEYLERFRREIEITQSLDSPNIVRVLDLGEDGSQRFFVMEYVEGLSLREMLRQRGALSLQEALDIAMQIAAALVAAHSKGVVHRDIKPENIVVEPDGRVKVGDFGIARAQDHTRLTLTGAVMGTVQYMAPELLTGGGDARSDIYSLGVILYQMLVGAPPFEAPTPWEILRKHREDPVPDLETLDIPHTLVPVLGRCLAKEPGHRYQDASSLSGDLIKAIESRTDLGVGARPPQPTRDSGLSPLPSQRLSRPFARAPWARTYVIVVALVVVLAAPAGVAALFFWPDGRSGASAVTPLSTSAGSEVTTVSAGAKHTCALRDGGVWCWGDSDYGQLGDGYNVISNVPVSLPELANVSALSAGTYHTCAVRDGVWCWGANQFGELGDGTRNNTNVPVAVSGLASGARSVSAGGAGGAHTCALSDGGVWCWGWNNSGEIGDGTTNSTNVPVAVSGLENGVSALSTGFLHTCALKSGGVWCWGENSAGQLGDGTVKSSNVPVAVSGLGSGVSALGAGGRHTCAVKSGGVWCWGDNPYGQLGNGKRGVDSNSSVPVAVSALREGVSALSVGGEHTCAVKDGAVWCWGLNHDGQLGDNSTTDSDEPVAASRLTSGISAVSAGSGHTCAIKDGTVWCWGLNSSGQLGDGTTTDSLVPVEVHLIAGAVLGGSPTPPDCGKDLSVTIDGPSPIGRIYHEGETLAVTLKYDAPGCTRIYPGIFVGRHAGNTVWARSLCGTDGASARTGYFFESCPGGVESRILAKTGVEHITSQGTYSLVGDAGSGPAENLESRADIDGFELCGFWVGFSDGSVTNPPDPFPVGHGTYYGWDQSGERRGFANC